MADKQMKFSITADDRASSVFARVGVAVGKLGDQLDELGRKRPNPKVTLDSTAAKARLDELNVALRGLNNQRIRVDVDLGSARADVGALRRELSYLRDTRFKVEARTGTTKADLTAIAAKLRELRDVNIRVDADTSGAVRSIARMHQQVSALRDARIKITVEINPPGIEARLTSLAALLGSLSGTTRHDVDVNTGSSGSILSKLTLKMAAYGAAALYAVPALGSLTSATASLGGSLVSLAGLAPLAVGGLTAMGAAAGALAVGLAHVGDALGPTGTPAQLKKVNEALAQLSPAARSAVTEIRGLGPAWSTVRLDVQERLFKGLSGEIGGLANTYLPVLKTGLGGITTEFNALGQRVIDFVKSAATVRDVNTIFFDTRAALEQARPAATNLLAAFRDIAVVGTSMLPELATGWTNATARFADFVAAARQSGQLKDWIQGGLDTLRQLGQVAVNTGGILASIYTAAKTSGADFLTTLERVTGGVEDFLKSARGQNTLVAFFSESRAAIDAVLPGLATLAVSAADGVAAFSNTGGLVAFGQAVSQAATAIAPLVVSLTGLAGGVLRDLSNGLGVVAAALSPVISGVTGAADGLGRIVPLAVAAVIAFKTFGLATASVVALGTAMTGAAALTGTLTAGLTGSLAAGALAQGAMTRLGTAVSAAGRALPLVGVAVVALGAIYSEFAGKADEAAGRVVQGSQSMQAAIAGEAEQIRRNQIEWLGGMNAADSYAAAQRNVTAEVDKARAALSPMAQLQSDVARAQTELNDAVVLYGPASDQARDAASRLSDAQRLLSVAQGDAATATKTHTQAMVEQMDQSFASADAGIGYERSLATLKSAQEAAATAAREHGASSDELKAANLELLDANLRTAESAGRKAEADAVAAGASNSAEIAAQAQKDELIRLAGQASGPTRQALLDMAAGSDVTSRAAATAEIQARLHKDELNRLAGEANGPLAAALRTARDNFDALGGANATASQKAQAQKDELLRLAGVASGPLRTELLRMADQIRTLPDGSFTVTANGVLTPLAAVRLIPGIGQFATGGVLPGYTPGKDVHDFVSPTGGRLALSGGEAIMRPEWTRAVGPDWVEQANAAARSGGVRGVQDFMGGRGFASGGIYGPPPARFAMGGVIRAGAQPFERVAGDKYYQARAEQARRMTVLMQAAIRAEDQRRAAQAAAIYGGGPPGAGVERWRPMVGQALGIAGQPQTYQNITLRRMNQESGGNPNAINRTDINAQRGTPSVGLMQVIGPTYRSYKHPSYDFGPYSYGSSLNPISNTLASMRYALRRYGSLPAAYNKAGGYASGGVIPGGLFDRGGLLRHGQAAINLSGMPERVLSPEQTRAHDRGIRAGGLGQVMLQLGPVVAAIQALRSDVRAMQLGGGATISNHFAVELGEVAERVAQVQRTQSAQGMFG